MTNFPASRWMLSFADLVLLLLGFFIMLHASGQSYGAVAAGTRAAFSGKPAASSLLDERAAALFEPGEASLTAPGRARIAAIGRSRRSAVIESVGTDGGSSRFDSWELAAARAAAVARALHQSGMPEDRVRIVLPPDRDRAPPSGQRLILR